MNQEFLRTLREAASVLALLCLLRTRTEYRALALATYNDALSNPKQVSTTADIVSYIVISQLAVQN